MNYYLVLCKCGHVSRKYYMPIYFCVMAENSKEAAKIARDIPRVKRDHKDAILEVKKVCKEDYDIQNEKNNQDPYLLCKSKHDQNEIMDFIRYRLVREKRYEGSDVSKFKNRKPNLVMQEKKYMHNTKFYFI